MPQEDLPGPALVIAMLVAMIAVFVTLGGGLGFVIASLM